jgi:hypothetical protein
MPIALLALVTILCLRFGKLMQRLMWQRGIVIAVLTAAGCDIGSLPGSDGPRVSEGISREQFVKEMGRDMRLPLDAANIYTYSLSSIDDWETRALMDLPEKAADRDIAALQKVIDWKGEAGAKAKKVIRIPESKDGPIAIPKWPSDHGVPRWWQKLTWKQFAVVGIESHNDEHTVWLYSRKTHQLAMWKLVNVPEDFFK